MMSRVWRWYLALMLPGVPAWMLTTGVAQSVVYHVYGLLAVGAIIAGLRLHQPQRRGPWIAFAAGTLLLAIGDVVFDIYDAVGAELPLPSVADVVYLSAYPVLAWGMVLIARSRVRGADLTSTLDGLMVAIGVGVVAWVFVLRPYVGLSELTVMARLVPLAYPVMDLVIVAVAVRLWFARSGRNPSFWLLSAGVFAMLLADGLYIVAALQGGYVAGNVIETGWLLSYVLWGAAALHPSMAAVTDPAPETDVRRGRAALAVVTPAVLTAPAVLIISDVVHAQTEVTLLAATSATMFLLVMVRLVLLTRAQSRSNRRLAMSAERQVALTRAATAFVGAGDVDSVMRAAVRAAVELAGVPKAWASFVATQQSAPIVAATAGPAPWAVGDTLDDSLAQRWADPDGRDDGVTDRFAAPVVVDEQSRGVLVVAGITHGEAEFLTAFRLVCSQMALAMQSVEAMEQRLQARNERLFRSLVQHASDVVTLVDAECTIRYQSPGARLVLGCEPEALLGRRLTEFVHPDDLGMAHRQFAHVLAGGLGESANVECRTLRADGMWRDVDTIVTNLIDDPDVGAIVLNSRDVTERRALERELNRQAFHDSLTGLANRALFLDRVGHALHRAGSAAEEIAVLYLDIDDFKFVNDSLGHTAGDELLVAVAERLRSSARPGDTVARLGGDEFAVLLESGAMPAAAQAVAGRIAEVLRPTIRVGQEDVSVGASIGIAVGRPLIDDADSLLRDADLAMYMAKRNSKGRFELFQRAMHDEAVRRLEVAADLRRAIENDQLELYYQPIHNVHSGAAVGAEALLRWNHPSRGLVSPMEFIPVAESTGLIVPIGRWVLNEACRQARSWLDGGLTNSDFYVSVNLSARQLQDPDLVGDVASALRDSGLPAGALLLEVTESVLIDNPESATEQLLQLKRLGLRLAVDDFGTGYCSLTYVRNLPVDVVKIDKTFVDRITLDSEGEAIVRSVIDLTAALGLTSIAEGVEQRDQLALLDELGCDGVQGYLFAKPMPQSRFADTMTALAAERGRSADGGQDLGQHFAHSLAEVLT